MHGYSKWSTNLGQLTMGNASFYWGVLRDFPESLVVEENRRYNEADFATSWGYEVWLFSWSF